jgi:hypothetical protein
MILAATGGGIAPRFTCDPALTALFTPSRPKLGQYEVCTTIEPLEALTAPGDEIEALEALDGFGAAGPYDRPALARLYGGTRVRVARSWKESPGRFESVTRLSPHPDRSLTHLLPGTMEIRFVVTIIRASP